MHSKIGTESNNALFNSLKLEQLHEHYAKLIYADALNHTTLVVEKYLISFC